MTEDVVVGLVDYGAGNLRSVEFALEALDVPHRRVSRPEDLHGVGRIVLPGVGAAASAMDELQARDLVEPLREWEGPLLGICLGMQLLARVSEEDQEDVPCLGLLPGRVRRLRAGDDPLPHMGWNGLSGLRGPLLDGIPEDAHVYFLHSLCVEIDAGRVSAWTQYGERFPAAVEADGLAGVQFHPEKSGAVGLRILANFAALPDPAARVRRALEERDERP